ncbi:AI-2 transport protein TqsA [Acaryochloris thomasi RCC1774]|uniref:AI-2 transport protein TqsA n=1 Tax=Acaryochloris thomasi RCC1774 TaxID=1764569 RepID=A0A2W1JG30_9CYAN|nr:AI-2E family transporter [Acaryochloris thomasi]PZD70182.1 AI-2 transport protein TqsA [Acaryochloris thomasi RCC1774]
MKTQSAIVSLLVSLASVVLIVAGLKTMASLLTPILLSLFLVLVTYPIFAWLKGRGLPQWLAYMLVLLSVVAIGVSIVLFLVTSVNELVTYLPAYGNQIETQINGLWQRLTEQGVTIDDIQALSWLQPEQLIQFSLSLTTTVLGTLSNTGLTLLIFVYMLATAPSFSTQLKKGLENNPSALQRFEEFAQSTSSYLMIKGWLGALTALVQMLLMGLLGLDFAVLWGVLSFAFNFIPNIGFYIALAPPLLIAIIELGWLKALFFAVAYIVINNFFDMVVAPRYLSKGLDLSILVTFLAVIIWAWILGPIGAFLALPLTIMVKKLLLEPFSQTQLVASLMGAGSEDS